MEFLPLDKKLPFQGLEAIQPQLLETFPYEYRERETEIEITSDEFTAVCPYSGLPDFGSITIRYVPDEYCVELRALKYYLLTFRNVGIYYEHLVNRVLDDIVSCCSPRRITVEADYRVRGGLKTRVSVSFRKP